MNRAERIATATALAIILDECRERVLSSSTGRSWRKKEPDGAADVVTDLDIWVEERIIARVCDAFPGSTTFSEEAQNDPDDLQGELCFVIDPIDGTAELLLGKASYAISVAVVCEGRVEVGLVDFPKQGIRYEARREEGARQLARRLAIAERQTLSGARIAVTPRQRTNPELVPVFGRLVDCELVDIRPITAKLAGLSVGNVDAGVYLPHLGSEVAIWDYAAAGLIVEEAGGRFISLSDRRPIMDTLPIRHQDGWLASSQSLEDPLLAALDGVPS